MIYINFKTYEQGTGEQAIRMAEMIYRVRLASGIMVVPVVQALDLYRVSGVEWDWSWCEHVDPVSYGANSGWLLPEGIKKNGGNGVMLNHAERKIRNRKFDLRMKNDGDSELLKLTVERCRAVGLSVGICADSLEEVEAIVPLQPDWIAYEPPELIGSKELSVSTAKPDVVAKAVEMAGNVKMLIGAGIKTAEDIRIGLRLGAVGFLIASSVVTAEDPEIKLRELIEGYE